MVPTSTRTITGTKKWTFVSLALGVALLFIISRNTSFNKSDGGECLLNFGEYKGHVYKTKETRGTPKCLLQSKWMKVQQHRVQFEGKAALITDWLWIDYHDRINVLVEAPRNKSQKNGGGGSERRFHAFLQSKYALEGRTSKAIIGGIIEPGEKPELSAEREIREEMGLKCDELHFLGRFRTDVNRGIGWVNSFLAVHCHPVVESKGDEKGGSSGDQVGAADVERQDLITMSQTELKKAVLGGEFIEVQWSNTVSMALLHPELAGG